MKIGFVSLGCPKNLVDSEVMMGLLEQRGHELVTSPEQAEAIVVNTCSFIDPAKQESVETILEMARYKHTGQAKRLVVAGCLVERYRDEIRNDIPEVDAVLGTNELESVVAHCEGWHDAPAAGAVSPYLYHDLTPRRLATPRRMADRSKLSKSERASNTASIGASMSSCATNFMDLLGFLLL